MILLFFTLGVSFALLPDVKVLKSKYPVITIHSEDQDPEIKLVSKRPLHWMGLKDVSRSAVGAIVVSEDWAFYQHSGFDWNQIWESIEKNWNKKRYARGASTITQQVVRNIFLDSDKNLWRKLKELYLAVRLEQNFNKQKILELYLNIAEWGEGIYGIYAASWHYFNKEPRDLTAKEGAFLALLLPSPKRYSVSYRNQALTQYAKTTLESILTKMVQAGFLDENEKDRQIQQPLLFERQ
jgi:monofunctional biosynthetic peptidoglycan transglycosylase